MEYTSPSIQEVPHDPNTPLYEQDFYAWTQEQGALLRDRKTKALDYVNLAEEVESLGKSQQHALESRLEKLVLHLLKWHIQPAKRLRGQTWQRTILEQRRRIDRLPAKSESPPYASCVDRGQLCLYPKADESRNPSAPHHVS